MTFLPKGEKIPSTSKYMKFVLGDNRFRVVSSAITGYELWVEGKPIRRKDKQFTSEELKNADINKFTGNKKIPQYFWAFVVYNHEEELVQILEIKQVTIMRAIEGCLADPDYGDDPKKYDFVVVQTKPNDKVEYGVRPKPPKELDEEIQKECDEALKEIRLEALFDGGDPFSEKDMDEIDKALE